MTVGSKIRQARLKKDLSQRELATEVGIGSGMFISQIESGNRPIPYTLIIPLCRALGIDRNDLILAIVKDLKAEIEEFCNE